jgi:hypothetical protein
MPYPSMSARCSEIIRANLFAILTFAVSNIALAQCCDSRVSHFLKRPGSETYIGLMDDAGGHLRDECRDILLKPTVNAKLLRSVETGNQWGIRVLVEGLSSLDGGELEDAHRALGVSFEHNPRFLLKLYAEQRLTSNELTDSLTMLPLSHVDDKPGTLARLLKRKAIVTTVLDTKLLKAKRVALAALQEGIGEVKKWPEEHSQVQLPHGERAPGTN